MHLRKAQFVTTPIFYVNADPHIGHLYSAVLADALSRTHRLLGHEVLFTTGTDEHGIKIQQAADKARTNPSQFCDLISSKFQKLFDEADVSYTRFIRTTEARHRETVAHFWRCLDERGHIYKGRYEGWYSTADEAFVSNADVVEGKDGIKLSRESGQHLEWTQEDNYMFRLSLFERDLRHWLQADPIQPKKFGDVVRRWLDDGLSDLSVSRQRSRLQWGVPVPDDDTQTVYVWLDALVNYLTVADYPDTKRWPVDCHVIGKDILRFHAIYWPAFLIGAGLEPPLKLFCHSHWMVHEEKMSKSRGNVVDPFQMASTYTFEGLRYFLLREAVPHSDANFTEKKLKETVNAELADTLGNLLSRCIAPSLNPTQTFPRMKPSSLQGTTDRDVTVLVKKVQQLPELVRVPFVEGNFHQGLDSIMGVLRNANSFLQTAEPWRLAKEQGQEDSLSSVLHVACETLRVSATLLQPAVPRLSASVLDRLGVPPHMRDSWMGLRDSFPSLDGRPHPLEGSRLGSDSAVVFPRIK